jgi:hypothetical protein
MPLFYNSSALSFICAPPSMSGEPEAEPSYGVSAADIPKAIPVWPCQALPAPAADFTCVNPAWLAAAAAPAGERAYCVWSWPQRPDLTGIWCGSRRGFSAWHAILAAEPSRSYAKSGIRCNAYSSLEDAVLHWTIHGPRETRGTHFDRLFVRFQ